MYKKIREAAEDFMCYVAVLDRCSPCEDKQNDEFSYRERAQQLEQRFGFSFDASMLDGLCFPLGKFMDFYEYCIKIFTVIMFMTDRKIEDRMIFASSCVESAARVLGVSAKEMYQRMKRVNLIEGYILKHYEAIHTESRKNITEDIVGCLLDWEKHKIGKENAI